MVFLSRSLAIIASWLLASVTALNVKSQEITVSYEVKQCSMTMKSDRNMSEPDTTIVDCVGKLVVIDSSKMSPDMLKLIHEFDQFGIPGVYLKGYHGKNEADQEKYSVSVIAVQPEGAAVSWQLRDLSTVAKDVFQQMLQAFRDEIKVIKWTTTVGLGESEERGAEPEQTDQESQEMSPFQLNFGQASSRSSGGRSRNAEAASEQSEEAESEPALAGGVRLFGSWNEEEEEEDNFNKDVELAEMKLKSFDLNEETDNPTER